MFSEDPFVLQLLLGTSRSLTSFPTQRRHAIQFKYSDIPRDHSMENVANFAKPKADVTIPTLHGNVYNEPSDSWEIELCVGFVIDQIIEPHWAQVRRLGRALMVFKVHKAPAICELFFMPRDEVLRTYKESNPKVLELVHMYNPETELAFWAELYRPSVKKAGRGTSILTDELCGAFGSRFCVISSMDAMQRLVQEVRVTSCRQECEGAAAKAQTQIEKKRRKKDRQRQRHRMQRAEVQAEDRKLRADADAEATAAAKATRIPAPHLHGFDFAGAMALPNTEGTGGNVETIFGEDSSNED